MCAKFGTPNLPQSTDIVKNSNGGISNFWIYGQSLINANFHDTRSIYDIDVKLGPVTKLEKKNKTTSKQV